VGTGISAGAHLTPEARAAFEHAEAAFFLVTDAVAATWLAELNPRARSLHDHYENGVPRSDIYERMAQTILEAVRAGASVCAAFYGHPGVFVSPSHTAIARAREAGFRARMLPAVSAEDCLFADLGVDPGQSGCQSYEATDFLLRRRPVDQTAILLLWQVGAVGRRLYQRDAQPARLDVLVDYLRAYYGADHVVTLYEASPYPIAEPLIASMPLSELPDATPTPLSTLYVPPARERPIDPAMARALERGVV
jgi:uncharacterized protein YabN with tetrapyrrole methylase and pyrophosphatase domain